MPDQIITKEGHSKLKEEFEYLTKTKRQEIAKRIQTAKDLGDLSENAEYHDAKDAYAFNEGRISELNTILKNVTVVANSKSKKTVAMGSTITVKLDGKTKTFQIVSFNESDPLDGKISNESPLGLAFLDKKKGDKVVVNTPRGEKEYKIMKIE